jgi:uncharacterized OB-fold protein
VTASVPPIRPVPDDTTQFFWDALRAGQLAVLRCTDCGNHIHPPRPLCRVCLSTRVAPAVLSGRGRLYSWTVTMRAFHPYWNDKLPYILGRVELVEQPGLTLLGIVPGGDGSGLSLGQPMQVEARRVPGHDLVLPYLVPAGS